MSVTIPEPLPAVQVDTVDSDPPRRPGRRRSRQMGAAGIGSRPGFLTYGLLSAFILGSIYPVWWSFVVASGTNATRGETLPLIPGGNFLANAARVLDAIPFWLALGNSVLISSIITISVVSFSTIAGYAFAKLRFRGRNGLMIFVIATMAIPTQLGIIPLFMVMRELGWTGTIGAVIVPTLVTAFGVFFMRQYLVDVIPDELIEAARMDGANSFRTFLTVGVPAARPAMAILGLFTFMTAWTDYLWPLIVLSPQNPTLQTALSQLQSGYYIDYSIVLTGAVLATLPLLVLFIIAGRQLISGIMAGAVKG
jgi:cellobiose transport system permease protein